MQILRHVFFDLVIPLLGIHSWDINFANFAKKYRQESALQHSLLTTIEENKHRFIDGGGVENEGPLLSGTKKSKWVHIYQQRSISRKTVKKVRCETEQPLSYRTFTYLEM